MQQDGSTFESSVLRMLVSKLDVSKLLKYEKQEPKTKIGILAQMHEKNGKNGPKNLTTKNEPKILSERMVEDTRVTHGTNWPARHDEQVVLASKLSYQPITTCHESQTNANENEKTRSDQPNKSKKIHKMEAVTKERETIHSKDKKGFRRSSSHKKSALDNDHNVCSSKEINDPSDGLDLSSSKEINDPSDGHHVGSSK
jgi:hypothetical protein